MTAASDTKAIGSPLAAADAESLHKTVAICLCLESVIWFGCWASTGSAWEGALTSILYFGPLSAWVGPRLYRHFNRTDASAVLGELK